MHEVSLFVEDFGHEEFLKAFLPKVAKEFALELNLSWRNSRGGYGAVIEELRQHIRDIKRERHQPDLIIIATDSNCKGIGERKKEINSATKEIGIPIVCAIPEPHIERWLIVDGKAFKTVFGAGCDAPDQKCDKDRYKTLLREAILKTGISPDLGGIEFSEDIVNAMDLTRASNADDSLKSLIEQLRSQFKQWTKK